MLAPMICLCLTSSIGYQPRQFYADDVSGSEWNGFMGISMPLVTVGIATLAYRNLKGELGGGNRRSLSVSSALLIRSLHAAVQWMRRWVSFRHSLRTIIIPIT